MVLLAFPGGAQERDNQPFFAGILDKRIATIRSIRIDYLTTRNTLSTEDHVSYQLEGNPQITAIAQGDLARSLYTVKLKDDYSPASFEHNYQSHAENLDFWEQYQYESPVATVFTDLKTKRSTRFANSPGFADSVTMMEYLVFARTEDITELRMSTAVSPGALRLPFVFRRCGEERVIALDGSSHDCWIYSAEVDNLLSLVVRLFYGDAKIWVMKDFPHLRVKMDFFRKNVVMKSYSVEYETPLVSMN
jgi:hypothetical protein